LIYLDGNSLGPPLIGVADRVGQIMSEWQNDLIRGWWDRDWLGLPRSIGSRLEPIVGAEPGSVICADSTTVALFKLVEVACDLIDGDLLTDSGNFPTDLYVLNSVARRRQRRLRMVEPEAVVESIDESVGLVVLTQVDFRTGRLHDLATITARAHSFGARVVWDLSHSAGVMPIELARHGVDLAVGCGYKYLNGGPGAPGYAYVSPALIGQVVNPINGWFSHRDPFAFSLEYVPAPGIERMQVGTPPVLSLVAMEAALEVWPDVDLGEVRSKSVGLTSLFIDLVGAKLGIEVLTPVDPNLRGGQVSLRLARAGALIETLATKGVVGDFRPPDVARFGFSPLYIGFVDVWEAARRIEECLSA
jgi:kynureninase